MGDSGNCLQALLLNQRQKFERGTGRVFLSALPLADKARRNIQVKSEHGLTHALTFTKSTNVTRLHRAHRSETKFIEPAQCPLIHEARVVKI